MASGTPRRGRFLESWYNLHRRHSDLGYLSPVNFERNLLVAFPRRRFFLERSGKEFRVRMPYQAFRAEGQGKGIPENDVSSPEDTRRRKGGMELRAGDQGVLREAGRCPRPACLRAAILLSVLASQILRPTRTSAGASRETLSVGGKAVVGPVFAIANSSDLLVEETRHRILQVTFPRRTLRQSDYPAIPASAKSIDGCLRQDQTVAILDDAAAKRIIELSPKGAISVLPLPNAIGSVFSIAPWKERTYLVALQVAPHLVVHVSREGNILSKFGRSTYFTTSSGSRLTNHCRVYSASDFSRVATVDTLSGRITLWDPMFRQTAVLSLPKHPRTAETEAFLARRLLEPGASILTVELYGIPTITRRDLLVFPGISFSPPSEPIAKTPFAVDLRVGALRTFASVGAIGGQLVTDGRQAVLLDASVGEPVMFTFFALND